MQTGEEWQSTLGIIDLLFHIAQSGVHPLQGKKDIGPKYTL